MTATRLSHIEINVSDYARSIRFYDAILKPLGWSRITYHLAPGYCKPHHWTNQIADNFDPYSTEFKS